MINRNLTQFRVNKEVPKLEPFKCHMCGEDISQEQIGWFQWGDYAYLRYSCVCGVITAPPNVTITKVKL